VRLTKILGGVPFLFFLLKSLFSLVLFFFSSRSLFIGWIFGSRFPLPAFDFSPNLAFQNEFEKFSRFFEVCFPGIAFDFIGEWLEIVVLTDFDYFFSDNLGTAPPPFRFPVFFLLRRLVMYMKKFCGLVFSFLSRTLSFSLDLFLSQG